MGDVISNKSQSSTIPTTTSTAKVSLFDNDPLPEPTGSIISPTTSTGSKRHEDGCGIQLRTSARVSKKLKLEAEAALLSHTDQKKEPAEEKKPSEPEKPLKRKPHEFWSTEDKNAFFEALNEYGKDFDSIAKYMMSKVKKKGLPESCCKTRAQVRCFYYRTWNKISKNLNLPDGVQKLTQELFGLINFGEMRRKCGNIMVKNCAKLNELIYGGIAIIKVKGKTLRIRTPNCRAMRKLNQMDDSDEDKVPNRIVLELVPKDNETWHLVQSLSMNPRIKTTITNHTKLASVLNHLQKIKWKQQKGVLRVTPHPGVNISLPNIKANEPNTAANSAFSLVNHEKKFGSLAISNAILSQLNQIRHSTPGSRKRQRLDSANEKIKIAAAAEVNAIENCSTGGIEKKEPMNPIVVVNMLPTPHDVITEAVNNTTPTTSPNKEEDERLNKELPKKESILKGWTLDCVHNTQIGHLYSMFGSEGKVCLQYGWEDVKPQISINATLQHLLLVAKLVLNKNKTQGACPCGHSCDIKPSLSSLSSDSSKHGGETFKRPRPKVAPPIDDFQAQLDRFQPNNKRFKTKNLIVQRVPPLNHQSRISSTTNGTKSTHLSSTFNGSKSSSSSSSHSKHGSTTSSTTSSKSSILFISKPPLSSHQSSSMPVISHVNDPPLSTISSSSSLPTVSSSTSDVSSSSQSEHLGIQPNNDILTGGPGDVLSTQSNLSLLSNSDKKIDCDFFGLNSSFNSTEAKEAAVLDELMDISFPHSEIGGSTSDDRSSCPSSFSGLIPTKDDSMSLPPSPSKLLKEGEHKWLNAEEDYSLSSLLGHLESPSKPPISSDMQSMISESSIDFTAKFADLAAQMANDEICKN